jgi:hypothetical protein
MPRRSVANLCFRLDQVRSKPRRNAQETKSHRHSRWLFQFDSIYSYGARGLPAKTYGSGNETSVSNL